MRKEGAFMHLSTNMQNKNGLVDFKWIDWKDIRSTVAIKINCNGSLLDFIHSH